MIEVKNISKRYDGVYAVDSVSFTVEKGEVFGLLGPNGAGKTTTLNIIAGVIRPDDGFVVVDGIHSTTDMMSIQQKIGYLSEDNPLYQNLMVYEMLELSRRLKHVSSHDYEMRKNFVILACGIESIFFRPIETLSKGLRQRVGIAAALIGDPDVLILDEPTEGLDPNQRQDIRALIRKLSKEHTIIVSTHVMQEVEAMCDTVVILDEGRVAIAGKVAMLQGVGNGTHSIEIQISGPDGDVLINELSSQFRIDRLEHGLVVDVANEREHEVYRFLAMKSTDTRYVTHLAKKTNKLEQIFRQVTRKDLGTNQ